jgi:ribosomal protein L4
MDAKKAVRAHEANMHPGKPKTFKAGGVTSAEMKKYGRNMARVMNQRSPTKARGRG